MSFISRILQDALSSRPDKEKYRSPDGFIKWGLVEREMNEELKLLEQRLKDAEEILKPFSGRDGYEKVNAYFAKYGEKEGGK